MKDDGDSHFDFTHDNKESKFEISVQKLKNSIFSLQYLVLKYQNSSLWMEILCLLIQMFQLLFFAYDRTVHFNIFIFLQLSDVQKPEKVFSIISTFLSYFHIVPFFRGSKNMYFITYYLLVIIAIFLTLLLVYIVVNSSKPNSKTLRACARLYKGIMYFASNIFFPSNYSLFPFNFFMQ